MGKCSQTQDLFWRQITGRANGFGVAGWKRERVKDDSRFQALAIGLRMEAGRLQEGLVWKGGCVELRLGFVKFEIGRTPSRKC